MKNHSTSKPEISYIVSLYNRPEYLAVCLYSLRMQNPDDFEVIVTDNSTDPVMAKQQKSFVAGLNDSRFRYVKTLGKIEVPDCYWSAEYGMQLARGKWLCFPCEDCYYPPDWTQRLLGNALLHGWDLALCGQSMNGPETSGHDSYDRLELGSIMFPGYKPSFIVRASKFPGWINKPKMGACSGVDRTTLMAMVRDPGIKWGVVRSIFYAHN